MPDSLHPLLKRQLRRHLIEAAAVDKGFLDLLRSISCAYHDADSDRQLSERALEISSGSETTLSRDV